MAPGLVVSLIPRGEVSTIVVGPLTLSPGDDGAQARLGSQNQHRVAVAIEAIFVLDCVTISS